MRLASLLVYGVLGTVHGIAVAPISRLQVQKVVGEKSENSYLVRLRDGVNRKLTVAWLQARLDEESSITYEYDLQYLSGFAGKFSNATLEKLVVNKDIESISEDAIMSIAATQLNAPWGLHRISHPGPAPSAGPYNYVYPDSAGVGVDIYVLDTGINVGHVTFDERAFLGWTGHGSSALDGNGHGTHCAGIAAGSLHGVAKRARVIAVKILSDTGSGSVSTIIGGINWTINQAQASGRPSIISMSFGGPADTSLDNGVTSAVYAGIPVIVAAGNSNTDAGSTSPARAPAATAVGALTISDARASFSNYGAVIDLWAPGQNVLSAWIGSTTAVKTLSGTSQATPYVAGIYALYLSAGITPMSFDYTASGLRVLQVPPASKSSKSP